MPSLSEISLKHVLLAVGVLCLGLMWLRLLPRRRRGGASWLSDHLQVVLAVIVTVFLIVRPFLFQAFFIPSASMEPTLLGPRTLPGNPPTTVGGDRLLANKLFLFFFQPRRKDIIVFKAPPSVSPDEKEFIKRVIGLPGDTVEVVPPRLLVDGKPLLALPAASDAADTLRVLEDALPVATEGNRAQLSVTLNSLQSADLTVLVQPNPALMADSYRVNLMGERLLSDDLGRIQRSGSLGPYGADPRLRAWLYQVAGEPRLVVAQGSRLEYDPGHVLINGRRLDEPYLAKDPHYRMAPRKLGPGEFFMMGDNRNDSNDSHMWGPLRRERMIGRAEVLFWPLDRFRIFDTWLISVLVAAYLLTRLLGRLFSRPAKHRSRRPTGVVS